VTEAVPNPAPANPANLANPANRANLAALDCGTLSTRLLVSTPDGAPIVRLSRITRLGEGVDSSGSLQPGAVERVLSVLAEYREVMDQHGAGRARMVGTSAVRDSANRAEFSQRASAIVGAPLELLSGQEEAQLSFLGATSDLAPGTAPWLVVDIGGGSTELVVGPEPSGASALDLGCVRVRERFLAHDPPSPSELAAARSFLTAQYLRAEAEVRGLRQGRTLVGLAGTVSALACFDLALPAYDRKAVHHHRLSRAAVERALGQLAPKEAAERAGLPGIEAARAPFIVAGALVLSTLMAHFGFEQCLVSEADILDGLVLSLIAVSQAATPAG